LENLNFISQLFVTFIYLLYRWVFDDMYTYTKKKMY